jgi:hypothetical protein
MTAVTITAGLVAFAVTIAGAISLGITVINDMRRAAKRRQAERHYRDVERNVGQ